MKLNWLLILLWLFLSPFIIGGAIILFISMAQEFQLREAKTWKPTTALLKTVSLDARVSEGSEENTLNGYTVNVTYKYTWEGIDYEGNKIAFGYGTDQSKTKDKHIPLLEKLEEAKNKHIKIWVDSNDPKKAVISTNWNYSLLKTYVYACVLIFFATGFGAIFSTLLTDSSFFVGLSKASWFFLILTFIALFFLQDIPDLNIIEEIGIINVLEP